MTLSVISSSSAGNCYVLDGGRSALILECGVPPERVMAGCDVDFSKIDAALISHEHGDHAAYAARFADMGIDIYSSAGTLRAIGVAGKRVEPLKWAAAGDFSVCPFPVRHDAAEPLGFVIMHKDMGCLLFLTDSCPIPLRFRTLAPDHIMVEANYDEEIVSGNVIAGSIAEVRARRLKTTHMSISQAVAFVKANETPALQTVTLLHLSGDNADREGFRRRMAEAVTFASVEVAHPGMKLQISKTPAT